MCAWNPARSQYLQKDAFALPPPGMDSASGGRGGGRGEENAASPWLLQYFAPRLRLPSSSPDGRLRYLPGLTDGLSLLQPYWVRYQVRIASPEALVALAVAEARQSSLQNPCRYSPATPARPAADLTLSLAASLMLALHPFPIRQVGGSRVLC